MTKEEIVARIEELKRKRNAVLLGHFYARPEVQDVCDYVGDSLGLSRQAAETDADVIVFCGVHFMAETASILAQDKTVLIPVQNAGCSLAESITGAQLKAWREQHPEAVVISYVNTTADIKAYTDCCCTSANAVQVVEHYRDAEEILFLPDWNLGHYIQAKINRPMKIWNGDCCVHARFTAELIQKRMEEYPEAEVLIHPESPGANDPDLINNPRVYVGSTSGMIARAGKSEAEQLIVVTEVGTLHKMGEVAQGKQLIPISLSGECQHMKYATLEEVMLALEEMRYEVRVDSELAAMGKKSIDRMLAIG